MERETPFPWSLGHSVEAQDAGVGSGTTSFRDSCEVFVSGEGSFLPLLSFSLRLQSLSS